MSTLPACSEAAVNRLTEIYGKIESVPGTAETLTDADIIEITDNPSVPNPFQRADIENLSRTSGLDSLPSEKGQTIAQQFTFKTYMYYSEAIDSPPHLSQLWEGLTGTETINGGTSVVYSASAASSALPSLTFLVKTDNESMQFAGRVDQAVITVAPSDDAGTLIQVDWTVQIFKWYFSHAGRATGTATANDVLFTGSESKRFSVDAIVYDGTLTLVVTAVDHGTKTITLDAPPGDGAVTLSPWSPGEPVSTPWSELLLEAHLSTMEFSTLSGVALNVEPTNAVTYTWPNNLQVKNNETGRGLGSFCVHRTENRQIVANVDTVQYDHVSEFDDVAENNEDLNFVVTLKPADTASAREITISTGTNGVVRLTPTGTGEDTGLVTKQYDAMYKSTTGDDTASEITFA